MTRNLNLILSLCLLAFLKIDTNAQLITQSKHIDVYSLENQMGNIWETTPYVFINYQKKWPQTINSNNYRAGGKVYFSEFNSSLTFNASHNSVNKIFNQSNFDIGYVYSTKLNYYAHLYLGLKARLYYNSINYSNLTFESGTVYNNKSVFFPDASFSIGTKFFDQHYVSISIGDILNDTDNKLQINNVILNYSGHYKKQIGNYMSIIEPDVMLKYTQQITTLHYGTRLKYSYTYTGLYINQRLNMKFNAITILLGINSKNSIIFYSYDINLYKNITTDIGFSTHEVTFLQKIGYKNQKRYRKAIKCPDI